MAIGRISGQMLKANLQRSGVDLAFETDLLVLDVSNSYVGVGTTSPARKLHINDTGALRLPAGTNAQRGSSANGDIRYNSDVGVIEGYSGGVWASMVGEGIDNIVEDTTPQLGGDLDLNSSDITGTGNVNISGSVTATSLVGPLTGNSAGVHTGNVTGNLTGDVTGTIDGSGSTSAFYMPIGATAERPSASTGVIRFNNDTGSYEGSTDGSTWVAFAMGGDNVSINKVTTTGDGSSTTFSGFFSTAPSSANNVMVFIDNVYQEPTENYTVSSNNITFTSSPHSGARIFALEGFDNTAVLVGGVARTLTETVSFAGATTVMSFNASTYRSAELYVQVSDAVNTTYSCMKALVVHNGSSAFITTYGVTNTGGADLADLTATYSSGTVLVQAASGGDTMSAIVQYSLAAV